MQGVSLSVPTDLEVLVQSHQREIWRYLRYLGCEPAQAEDLTQETFLAVLRKPFSILDPSSTAAYLRTVARNLFVARIRKSRIEPRFVDLDDADRVWTRYERDDDGDTYRRALRECGEELSEKDRNALRLRYGERSSRTGMAQTLGLTADGVKTLLRRIRDRLRLCIEGKLGHE